MATAPDASLANRAQASSPQASVPQASSSPASGPKQVTQAGAPDASKAMTLFVMIVATLYFGKEVLVPVVLALLLAFILAPVVDLLRRVHLGRVPSVLLGVVLAFGVILAIGGVIGSQIADLSGDIPRYASTIEGKLSSLRAATLGRVNAVADRLGERLQPGQPTARAPGTAAPAPAPAASAPAAPAAAAPTAAAPAASAEATSPMALAERYLSPVLSPLATLGIVVVITIFALLQQEDLRDRLIRLIGSDDLHRTTLAIDDGGRRLSKYFLAQLCINTLFGVVITIGLTVIGVPSPVLWGILSALLRFVPYVGSFIAAALPMALAAGTEPGWSTTLWTLALYVVVEGLTGQVAEPLVYGHNTGLSPFSVVVAAIFWSWLWGPIGLILSTPLTLCLVVMGRHVQRLEFLDVILGDRPALTPVESFYQRILAGDADEAEEHAELLLKDRSLSTYYDEVALKGLQLAAGDAQRGAVQNDQLDRIRTAVMALVHGLENHRDHKPPQAETEDDPVAPPAQESAVPSPVPVAAPAELPEPWRHENAVLCIAGRGPLDEAASAMLAQLLAKRGFGVRLVGYEEASRERISSLDTTGVVMACVSYLDITGSPAHLRYLVRRLRQRLPPRPSGHAAILVGLWPAGDSALSDPQVQAQIGADDYASSLTGAVEACVGETTKQVAEKAAAA